MRAVASLLREPERARRYTELVSQIRAAFESRFFNRTTGSFGSQTADAMALHMGLAPRGEEVVPNNSRALATLPFSRQSRELGPGTHRLTDAPATKPERPR